MQVLTRAPRSRQITCSTTRPVRCRPRGCTVGEYVARLRMQEAERLLLTTRLPVEEIARRVGYRKASAFAERFRAHTGMTPAAYRRQRGREGS